MTENRTTQTHQWGLTLRPQYVFNAYGMAV